MEIKEPIIEEKSSFNLFTSIWLVPIVAFIIALWLTYEHFSKQGPLIKIYFKNSGGLVAGESVVKFRDVPVGKVTQIEINNNDEGVIVYARINKDAENFLNEYTQFWIVKPEVSYSGVRGLDTLLHGSYIKMHSKKGKSFKKEFIGLEHPFIDMNEADYYALKSNFELKTKKGTPLYFKGIKIGEVDQLSIDKDTKEIYIIVRVEHQYRGFINRSSKFWIQSLVDLKLNDNRLEVKMAPLPIMLLGGIAVDTKFDKNYDLAYDKIFTLHKNASEAKRLKIGVAKTKYVDFIFKFKGNVSSLEKGTKIKYKGFEIGEIKKLRVVYNKEYQGFEAFCFGKIDISAFSTNYYNGFENFKKLVKSGIIAKMKKPNPLFNKSDIVLVKDENSSVILKKDLAYNAYIIPTKQYEESGLIAKLSQLSDKLNKINIENINKIALNTNELIKTITTTTKDVKKTIDSLNNILKNIDAKELSANINKTLKDVQKAINQTIKTLKRFDSNSLFSDKLEATLKELHNSAEQTNRLIKKLNKKPNSLIFGE